MLQPVELSHPHLPPWQNKRWSQGSINAHTRVTYMQFRVNPIQWLWPEQTFGWRQQQERRLKTLNCIKTSSSRRRKHQKEALRLWGQRSMTLTDPSVFNRKHSRGKRKKKCFQINTTAEHLVTLRHLKSIFYLKAPLNDDLKKHFVCTSGECRHQHLWQERNKNTFL